MPISLTTFLATLSSIFRSRAGLQLENLALRHQISVASAFHEKMSQVDSHGPPRVGLAVPGVERLALDRYLLRDRDAIFGNAFRRQVRDMGIQEVLCTPRSPWQQAYVERMIGSIRRECLDHVLVFHETSLRRNLRSHLDYYHRSRTHLSLGKDSPE